MVRADNSYSLFLFRIALSFPRLLSIDSVSVCKKHTDMFLASMVKASGYQMSETMPLDRFDITVPPITT